VQRESFSLEAAHRAASHKLGPRSPPVQPHAFGIAVFVAISFSQSHVRSFHQRLQAQSGELRISRASSTSEDYPGTASNTSSVVIAIAGFSVR
jgi:hypothetical protein